MSRVVRSPFDDRWVKPTTEHLVPNQGGQLARERNGAAIGAARERPSGHQRLGRRCRARGRASDGPILTGSWRCSPSLLSAADNVGRDGHRRATAASGQAAGWPAAVTMATRDTFSVSSCSVRAANCDGQGRGGRSSPTNHDGLGLLGSLPPQGRYRPGRDGLKPQQRRYKQKLALLLASQRTRAAAGGAVRYLMGESDYGTMLRPVAGGLVRSTS